ncbi:CPBP family intramembrane glutamic endopeptidase [Aquiflexum gelatinilyticum]|uniref:CPBP family intramembrane metalloprotease n=1 Tax=Aquiflexum gelatinilyticum TaxID=2961943 RepID=A0A9X2T0H3_9BACT|nr:CPBP family intramembrane glutamic endopeptidase [Aquiflexum gelatinilyticum]MCR9015588.1 CPBP family intramembrane metalloprotease [Aquiflexum gelatinilyticum]
MINNLYLGFVYHGFAYFILFLISWWAYHTKSLKFFSENRWSKNNKIQFFLLASGILLWGIIPLTKSEMTYSYLLLFGPIIPTYFQVFLVLILGILAFLVGKSQVNKSDFKFHVFQPHPATFTIFTYLLFRILFLISYEIWFRGFFLNDLLLITSLPVGILVNIICYALIHIFAPPKEAWSSLGFGLILCVLVIYLEAVWPAIFIHLSLFMGYEGGFFWKFSKDQMWKTVK